jgi:hypothetical protein
MPKRFMIVKMAARKLGETLDLTPLPGLFDQPEAEAMIGQLRASEPDCVFMVQEVGTA